LLSRALFVALAAALAAPVWSVEAVTVVERRELPVAVVAASASHEIRLSLVVVAEDWKPESLQSALDASARILGQCGVAISHAEMVLIEAPARFRDFHTPVSRELARALPLHKPTVYFVAGTRQIPAFDAEAIGRGNSRARPELRDTVWVMRSARDLDIVVAHELAHVLLDSGEHSQAPGNLMREDTAPANVRLDETQCARMRRTAAKNGLLRSVR
jgi:hypothetical protein